MHVLSLDLEPRKDLPAFQGPRWLPAGIPCRRVKVWREPVPAGLAGYSHLILSGSTCSILDEHPFVAPVMNLIREAVQHGLPILGICYGHQLVAKALLGDEHVRRAARPEFGWLPVEIVPGHDALFAGLPNPFRVFVGHFDEVCDLPPDWKVVARSRDCAIQGVINRELKLLTFQFHPEMDLATGNLCFAADRALLTGHGADVDAILRAGRDDGSGRVLIPRFLNLSW